MNNNYGIIFDVDGVIADTEALNAQASIKVFEDILGIKGIIRKDFEAGLGRGAFEYVKAAAHAHNIELTPDQVARVVNARQDMFLQIILINGLTPFPGVRELFDAAMKDPRFKTAIATSSTRQKSQAVLESASIPFEKMVYVTGSDVKDKKPSPALFNRTIELLGFNPSYCMVIEDAPDGVEAAHRAGCKCIAVTNSVSREKLNSADRIVDTLKQVSLENIIQLCNL